MRNSPLKCSGMACGN